MHFFIKAFANPIFYVPLPPENECGEIWLLATTQKNAKM